MISVQAPQTKQRLATGTVLDDRFEITEFLGAGSFGEVYRAKQLIFGRAFRDVALKLFSEGLVTPENAYEILNDAIIVIGMQDEPQVPDAAKRIIQVYDMGLLKSPSPRAFMSMKLIPGKRTLKSEVYRFRHAGGMPVSLSLRYLRQLLIPLAWLHGLESPVVHGDLKPENIMFTTESDLVVVDFGLAARMPVGATGGTIAYDAPEKLLGLNGGPEADMYAVGIIWYEMLTGEHPFKNVGLEATGRGDKGGYVQAHIDSRKWPICSEDQVSAGTPANRIVPASEVNQDLAENHPQLEPLLNRCLAHDISKRFPNAQVLLDQIDAYIQKGRLTDTDKDVIGLHKSPPPSVGTEAEEKEKSSEAKLADAIAFLKQGKLDRALSIAEQMHTAEPKSVPPLLVEARALAKMAGRLDEALQICAKAQGLAPQDPDVYETLADVREIQGKSALAQMLRVKAAEFRRSMQRAPERKY